MNKNLFQDFTFKYYGFGSPRVGHSDYSSFLNDLIYFNYGVAEFYRININVDPLVRYPGLPFSHAGPAYIWTK